MQKDALVKVQIECRAYFQTLWEAKAPTLVFGDGNQHQPNLMLIGEAPGEQEALQGKPFVGKAGKNLNVFLQTVGLTRETIYISNVVKIRPSKTSAAGRQVNRPPTREEIELFTPWLMREIAAVNPRALVTLGNVALRAVSQCAASIGECHGQWQNVRIAPAGEGTLMLPLFALYHPASVIYNRALAAVYEADLCTLGETLPQSGTDMDT